jgi:hypothetical protein
MGNLGCNSEEVSDAESMSIEENSGSMSSCLSDSPNATTVSLCVKIPRVWKPKKRQTKDKCEEREFLCTRSLVIKGSIRDVEAPKSLRIKILK